MGMGNVDWGLFAMLACPAEHSHQHGGMKLGRLQLHGSANSRCKREYICRE